MHGCGNNWGKPSQAGRYFWKLPCCCVLAGRSYPCGRQVGACSALGVLLLWPPGFILCLMTPNVQSSATESSSKQEFGSSSVCFLKGFHVKIIDLIINTVIRCVFTARSSHCAKNWFLGPFSPLVAQIWEGSCFPPWLLCHIYNCGASLLFHCLSGGCEDAKSICRERVCFCTTVPFWGICLDEMEKTCSI